MIVVGTQGASYVHCNFGWGGDCDGYYVVDCFDFGKFGGPVIRDNDEKGYDNTRTDVVDYNYNTQIITYILK